MSKYYGVSQSSHRHEYRWIYKEEDLISQIGKEYFQQLKEDYGSLEENPQTIWWVDILFPIGGSNSSATVIQFMKDEDDVKKFLTATADGPDLEDPMLIDIAEYIMTVDIDCGSCTQEFLNKFGFTMKDLEQFDDKYNHRSESERMIAELLSSTDAYEDGIDDVIDRDSPFYGFSRDMRFSELCDIYEEFIQNKATETEEELEG